MITKPGLRTQQMRPRVKAIMAAFLALVLIAAAGCGSSGSQSGGTVEITLAGPNQWNNDPKSFGPAWEDLVKRFEEEEPNIKVKTTVLPLGEFRQTLSTQLSAGTAPELVFSQAPHSAGQVHALDDYLQQPNPYVEGNKKWIDLFDPDYFSPDSAKGINAKGNREFIPLSFVIIGVFYNADILTEAGVQAPIKTYGELIDACGKIKAAGYTPFALDGGKLSQGWTFQVISSMLMDKYADQLNQFAPDGKPGAADQVTDKSMAKAILTGELDPTTIPEIDASLELTKKFFESCADPNWSGITGGAAFTGHDDFVGGRAAMAWGTNFATGNLEEVSWEWDSMPFPTIAKTDTPVATDTPARFGARIGGTNYMIPSTTEGEELEAAIKFLQFATSPEGGEKWLQASGGIPSTVEVEAGTGLKPLTTGEWAKLPPINNVQFTPKDQAGKTPFDGYLLGSTDLPAQKEEMKKLWIQWAEQLAKEGKWTEEWAK